MAGKNTITRTVAPQSLYPSAKAMHGSSTSYNQGDFLFLDSSTHLLRVGAAETDSAYFAGVAEETVVNGKLAKPYSTDVDASAAFPDLPGPSIGKVVKCVLKTGDSLVPGQAVGFYPTAGNRGVSSTVTTQSVGLYQGPAISGSGAGLEVEIYLHKFGASLL